MDFESHEICKACAIGTEKYRHNMDNKTCEMGRAEALADLPKDEQIRELKVLFRMSDEMAEMVASLCEETKKSPMTVLKESGLLSRVVRKTMV